MTTRLSSIRLEHVQYIPKQLEPGILYVALEYGAAAHLCACGCGTKIRTPLDATEWALTETPEGPSLSPSVGNWQQACQSHYVIKKGKILWAAQWTPEQVAAGRRREEARRRAYYDAKYARRGFFARVWAFIKKLFS